MLAYQETTGDVHGAALLKQVPPVAWQHINLYSRYEFNKRPELIDMDAIIQALAQMPVVSESAPIA